jgi:hypothetical protein
MRTSRFALLASVLAGAALAAHAQTDEIQVYDGSLAKVGEFTLTLHTNYVVNGIDTPAFPGAVVADHSLNGVPEFAYGVTDWFEAGLYLPVWSVDAQSGFGLDGFKLRALFAAPHGDERKFAYGVNFEFSVNATRWDQSTYTSEIRGILAWHLKPFDIIVNPIVDTDYSGLGNLDFVPCARVDYNFGPWAVALESYSDYGPVKDFLPPNEQVHQLFAVMDHAGKTWDVEFGAGFGLTSASDKFTLKLILARSLHERKGS